MSEILFVIYGSSEMGVYDVPMFMSFFWGFAIGMVFASFILCGMMLLFSCFIASWACGVVSVIVVVCS